MTRTYQILKHRLQMTSVLALVVLAIALFAAQTTPTAAQSTSGAARPIADRTAIANVPFLFTFAANTFIDAGDTLTYTLSGQPTWLGFEDTQSTDGMSPPSCGARTFCGTPTEAATAFTVTVTASDGSLSLMDRFELTVLPANTDAFITDWEVTDADKQIKIPTIHPFWAITNFTYDFTVNWGDGLVTSHRGDDPNPTHNYAEAARYSVTITGTFPSIYVYGGSSSDSARDGTVNELRLVRQWGTQVWLDLQNAFQGVTNFEIGPDAGVPDLSNIEWFAWIFAGALNFTGAGSNIGDWDVSNVESMGLAFSNAAKFNEDISDWNVSNVNNMHRMFSGAAKFNQDLGDWDVSKVNNMEFMLQGTDLSRENYDSLLNGWSKRTLQQYVPFHAAGTVQGGGLTQYSGAAQVAWETIDKTYNWTITDGGLLDGEDISLSALTLSGLDADNVVTTPTPTLDQAKVALPTIAYSATVAHDVSSLEVTAVPTDTDTDDDTVDASSALKKDVDGVPTSVTNPVTLNAAGSTTAITIEVTNANDTFTQPYTLTITRDPDPDGGNNAPTLVNPIGNREVIAGDRFLFAFPDDTFRDADESDTLTYSYAATYAAPTTGDPKDWLEFQDEDPNAAPPPLPRTFFGTPPANAADATVNVTVTATDPSGDAITDTFTLAVATPAADAFVTTWQTTADGESIIIPTFSGGIYDYDVNWGDGLTDPDQDGDATHAYAAAGTYTVTITRDFPQIYVNNRVDSKGKIQSVEKWGTGRTWASMNSAFEGVSTEFAINDSAAPTLAVRADMAQMFKDAAKFTGEGSGIGAWDVSQVTNMNSMFDGAAAFNQDLIGWDVSSVTNMSSMFDGASAFNSYISIWNVSKVTSMSYMFAGASAFNQGLGGWDISSVTNMQSMLDGSGITQANYESTLIGWSDLDTTTTPPETRIPTGIRLGAANAAGARYSSVAAQVARATLVNTYGWSITGDRVVNNTDIRLKTLALSGTKTGETVSRPLPLDQDAVGLPTTEYTATVANDFASVTVAASAFDGGAGLTMTVNGATASYPLTLVDGDNVITILVASEDPDDTISQTYILIITRQSANNPPTCETIPARTAIVGVPFSFTFPEDTCTDLDEFDTVTYAVTGLSADQSAQYGIYIEDISATEDPAPRPRTIFGTPKAAAVSATITVTVTATDGKDNAALDVEIEVLAEDLTSFITTWQTDANNIIRIPASSGPIYNYNVNWGDGLTSSNVAGAASHEYAVAGTYSVTITDRFPHIYINNDDGYKTRSRSVEQWGNQRWTSMANAFEGVTNFRIPTTAGVPDLTHSGLPNDTMNMTATFKDAAYFNSDISGWTVSNVTNMKSMFDGAARFNQDISGWTVSSVTNMSSMFDGATRFNQDISGWDVSSVTDMSSMFQGAGAFNQELNGWTTSMVTDMSSMFSNATAFNKALNGWNVSIVTDMSSMFSNAWSFNQDLSGWTVSSVMDMNNMFYRARVFNRNINGWTVSSVTDMSQMFYGAIAFDQDLGGWDISAIGSDSETESMEDMFRASGLSTASYDLTLQGWSAMTGTETRIPTGITLHGDFDTEYSGKAQRARAILTQTYGWTIRDDGLISGTDIRLSGITLTADGSNVSLNQATNLPTIAYTASVESDAGTLTVTPVTRDGGASATVNGIATTATLTVIPADFPVTFNIVVTARGDATIMQPYTLTITRGPACYSSNDVIDGIDETFALRAYIPYCPAADDDENDPWAGDGYYAEPQTENVCVQRHRQGDQGDQGNQVNPGTPPGLQDCTLRDDMRFWETPADSTDFAKSTSSTFKVTSADVDGQRFTVELELKKPELSYRDPDVVRDPGADPKTLFGKDVRVEYVITGFEGADEIGGFEGVDGLLEKRCRLYPATCFHVSGYPPSVVDTSSTYEPVPFSIEMGSYQSFSSVDKIVIIGRLPLVMLLNDNQEAKIKGSESPIEIKIQLRRTYAGHGEYTASYSDEYGDKNYIPNTQGPCDDVEQPWLGCPKGYHDGYDKVMFSVLSVDPPDTTAASAAGPETLEPDTQHRSCEGDTPHGNCPTLTLSTEDGTVAAPGDEITVAFTLARGANGGRNVWKRLTLETMCDPDFELLDENGNVVASSVSFHPAQAEERAFDDWRGDCRYVRTGGAIMTPLTRDDSSFDMTDRNPGHAGIQVIGPITWTSTLTLPSNFNGDWTLSASIDPREDATGNQFTSLSVAFQDLVLSAPEPEPEPEPASVEKLASDTQHRSCAGAAPHGDCPTLTLSGAAGTVAAPGDEITVTFTLARGSKSGRNPWKRLTLETMCDPDFDSRDENGNLVASSVSHHLVQTEERAFDAWRGQCQYTPDGDAIMAKPTRDDSSFDMTDRNPGHAGTQVIGPITWTSTLTLPSNFNGDWTISASIDPREDATGNRFTSLTVANLDLAIRNPDNGGVTLPAKVAGSSSHTFITTWETTYDGESITIPTRGSNNYPDDRYYYRVQWGDGAISRGQRGDATHSYATAGTHTVTINGNFPQIHIASGAAATKIRSVEQWGTQRWRSMSFAFAGVTDFVINASDTPDLSNVTDMKYMFWKAAAFNQDINQVDGDPNDGWDVSNVTNMSHMFHEAAAFNQDIGDWDVSNVKNMEGMFKGAAAFNQDIGDWDVSNVRNMIYMFWDAAAFNQDLDGDPANDGWDVSNVPNMRHLFYKAAAFNQALGGWDISNVTDMIGMFTGSDLSITNYDATLLGWSTLSTGETRIPTGVTLSAWGIQYSSVGKLAQDTLENHPYYWVFNDGRLADIVRNADIRIELDIVQAFDINHGVVYGGLVEGDDHRVSTWVKVFHVVPKAIGINPDGGTNPQLGTVLDYTQSDPEGRGKFVAVHENGTTEDLIGNYRSACWEQGTKNWEEGDALEHDEERLLLQSDSGGCPVYFYATIASGVYTVTLEVPVDRDADGVDDADPAVGTTTLTIVPAALTVEVEFDDSDATVSPVVGQTGFNVIFSDASGGLITDDSSPSLCYYSNCDHKIPSVSAEGGLIPQGSARAIRSADFSAITYPRTLRIPDDTDAGEYTVSAEVLHTSGIHGFASELTVSLTGQATLTVSEPLEIEFSNLQYPMPGNSVTVQIIQRNAPGGVSKATLEAITVSGSLTGVTDAGTNAAVSFDNSGDDAIWTWTLNVPAGTTLGDYDVGATTVSHNHDGLGNTPNQVLTATETLAVKDVDPNLFITTWSGRNIAIPVASGETYSYTVDWGDDSDDTTIYTGRATHDYGAGNAGPHTVAITGAFPRIYINGGDAAGKIKSVEQWGTQQWTSMAYAFKGALNLTIADAAGKPDLSLVTDMSYMFENAYYFNSDISHWDVDTVTNMERMFLNNISFNQDLGASADDDWNVANVRNFHNMFSNASVFNGDLSEWNPSAATNMNSMFYEAIAFNGDLSEWSPHVSNVTNFSNMFGLASAFTGTGGTDDRGIRDWVVSSGTNFRQMFLGARAFTGDVSGWDVSSGRDFASMFSSARAFNQNLGGWDISSVDDETSGRNPMVSMFNNTALDTASYDATLIGWSQVTGTETKIPSNINLGVVKHVDDGKVQYSGAAQAARDILVDDNGYNWEIDDGGLAASVRSADIRIELDIVRVPPSDDANTYGGLVEGDDHRVSSWVRSFYIVPKAIGINPDGGTNPQLSTVLGSRGYGTAEFNFSAVHNVTGTRMNFLYNSDCWQWVNEVKGNPVRQNWWDESGNVKALADGEEWPLLNSGPAGLYTDEDKCWISGVDPSIESGVYTVTLEVPVDRDADGNEDDDPAVGTTTLTIVPAALTVDVEFGDSDATVSPVVGEVPFSVSFRDASGGFISDEGSGCNSALCDHKPANPFVSVSGGLSITGTADRYPNNPISADRTANEDYSAVTYSGTLALVIPADTAAGEYTVSAEVLHVPVHPGSESDMTVSLTGQATLTVSEPLEIEFSILQDAAILPGNTVTVQIIQRNAPAAVAKATLAQISVSGPGSLTGVTDAGTNAAVTFDNSGDDAIWTWTLNVPAGTTQGDYEVGATTVSHNHDGLGNTANQVLSASKTLAVRAVAPGAPGSGNNPPTAPVGGDSAPAGDRVSKDTQRAACAGDSPGGDCPTLTLSADPNENPEPGDEITVTFSLARGAKGGNQSWKRLTLETMCDPDYELRDENGNVVASSESFHLVQEERAFDAWRGDCEYDRTGGAIMTTPTRADSSFDMTDGNPGAAGTQVIGPITWTSTLTLPDDFSGGWTISASIDPREDASGNRFTSLVVANQDLKISD